MHWTIRLAPLLLTLCGACASVPVVPTPAAYTPSALSSTPYADRGARLEPTAVSPVPLSPVPLSVAEPAPPTARVFSEPTLPAWSAAVDPAALEPGALEPEPLAAQQPAPKPAPASPWARVGLSVGGSLVSVDSTARVGATGVGIGVNLEELLGLDSTVQTLRLDAFWRFTKNRRHRLDVTWFQLNRSNGRVLEQDVDFGDIMVPAGSSVETSLDIHLLKAVYSYSILQDDRIDLALSGGLYLAPIDFQVQGDGITAVDERLEFTAPLPVFGLRMDFLLTDRWLLRSDVNVFYLEYDRYTGSIANWTGALEYRAFKHVALGLGLDSFRIGLESEGESSVPGVDSAGSLDFGYVGLLLYLKTFW